MVSLKEIQNKRKDTERKEVSAELESFKSDNISKVGNVTNFRYQSGIYLIRYKPYEGRLGIEIQNTETGKKLWVSTDSDQAYLWNKQYSHDGFTIVTDTGIAMEHRKKILERISSLASDKIKISYNLNEDFRIEDVLNVRFLEPSIPHIFRLVILKTSESQVDAILVD
jgi:hypothetical protein